MILAGLSLLTQTVTEILAYLSAGMIGREGELHMDCLRTASDDDP